MDFPLWKSCWQSDKSLNNQLNLKVLGKEQMGEDDIRPIFGLTETIQDDFDCKMVLLEVKEKSCPLYTIIHDTDPR